MLRVSVMYTRLVFYCFVFLGVYCAKHWNTCMKLFKNQIQVYQNTKKKPVLEILSELLSQLCARGIASRHNKSEDALILTVAAEYSDF